MKRKTTAVKFAGKTYNIGFTLGDMRSIETDIGVSLMSVVMAGADAVKMVTVDFIVYSLMYGLTDKRRTYDEVCNLIDTWCIAESLDTIGGKVVQAYLESGFFIPRRVLQGAEKKENR